MVALDRELINKGGLYQGLTALPKPYLQLPSEADNPVPSQYFPPVQARQLVESICPVFGLNVPIEQGYWLAEEVLSGQ